MSLEPWPLSPTALEPCGHRFDDMMGCPCIWRGAGCSHPRRVLEIKLMAGLFPEKNNSPWKSTGRQALLIHLVRSRPGIAGRVSAAVRESSLSQARSREKSGTKSRVLRKGNSLPRHTPAASVPWDPGLRLLGGEGNFLSHLQRNSFRISILLSLSSCRQEGGKQTARQRGRAGETQGSLWTGGSILVCLGPQAVLLSSCPCLCGLV